MEIYSLSSTGKAIAKSVRLDRSKPEANVLYFLKRQNGSATDDNIKQFVQGADTMLLARMVGKGYLIKGS